MGIFSWHTVGLAAGQENYSIEWRENETNILRAFDSISLLPRTQ